MLYLDLRDPTAQVLEKEGGVMLRKQPHSLSAAHTWLTYVYMHLVSFPSLPSKM